MRPSVQVERLLLEDFRNPRTDNRIHIRLSYALEGPVDPKALDASLRSASQRRPLLWSRFEPDGPTVAAHPANVDAAILTSSACDDDEINDLRHDQDLLEEALGSVVTRPFDRDVGPMIRAHLLHAEHSSILAIVIDHLVADDTSVRLLLEDVGDLYDSPSGHSWPETDGYPEWAESQRRYMGSLAARKDARFIREQVEDRGVAPAPRWHRTVEVDERAQRTTVLALAAGESSALREGLARNGLTLFVGMLAVLPSIAELEIRPGALVWSTWLNRWSRADGAVFGSVAHDILVPTGGKPTAEDGRLLRREIGRFFSHARLPMAALDPNAGISMGVPDTGVFVASTRLSYPELRLKGCQVSPAPLRLVPTSTDVEVTVEVSPTGLTQLRVSGAGRGDRIEALASELKGRLLRIGSR